MRGWKPLLMRLGGVVAVLCYAAAVALRLFGDQNALGHYHAAYTLMLVPATAFIVMRGERP